MLAHRTGQAIIIWRNTPACCVAETYNLLSFFVACGGSSKILIFSSTVCRAAGDSAVYLLELRDLRSFVCAGNCDS